MHSYSVCRHCFVAIIFLLVPTNLTLVSGQENPVMTQEAAEKELEHASLRYAKAIAELRRKLGHSFKDDFISLERIKRPV